MTENYRREINICAIPNLTTTINKSTANNVEPAIITCVASNQSEYLMNGTYIVKCGDIAFGNTLLYGPHKCFQQHDKPIFKNGYWNGDCWISRYTSLNIYDTHTNLYKGSTRTIVNGNPVLGEYVSITTPYSFVLSSYSITSANYNGVSNPAKAWIIGGSNDGGKTYDLVHAVNDSGLSLIGNEFATISKDYKTYNTNMYTTYIIIITQVLGGGAANLGAWNIYRTNVIYNYYKNSNGNMNCQVIYTKSAKKIDGI
jgi:hypothetical protein